MLYQDIPSTIRARLFKGNDFQKPLHNCSYNRNLLQRKINMFSITTNYLHITFNNDRRTKPKEFWNEVKRVNKDNKNSYNQPGKFFFNHSLGWAFTIGKADHVFQEGRDIIFVQLSPGFHSCNLYITLHMDMVYFRIEDIKKVIMKTTSEAQG